MPERKRKVARVMVALREIENVTRVIRLIEERLFEYECVAPVGERIARPRAVVTGVRAKAR
jgi:hypothetical protein